LDFEVDFDKKQFIGSVEHTLDCVNATDTIVMDMLGIDIQKVEQQGADNQTWDEITFKAHEDLNPNLGNALEITLKQECTVGKFEKVKITYTTNENSLAINWLTPAQTAGKKLPYLFTQCESIAGRSLAPMMDTPAIKITYDAKVSVEIPFVVKMSANETMTLNNTETNRTEYYFKN
jgi:leukotriene-A4 hydrolase